MIGDGDAKVTAEEANAWAEHTTGPFEMRTFPGGHFYLVDQSARIIGLISAGLAPARQS